MKPERDPDPVHGRPGAAGRVADDPVLPDRSRDDSDIGWGGHPEPDNDERLRQDRPPHWDSP